MKQIVVSLLQSRKVWLTVISVASAIGAYLTRGITADALAKIIAASVSVLVLAIAHEDNGAKGSTVVQTGGPTTIVPPALPSIGDEVTK